MNMIEIYQELIMKELTEYNEDVILKFCEDKELTNVETARLIKAIPYASSFITSEIKYHKVYIMIAVHSISDVNTVEQTFNVHFHIYLTWEATQDEKEKYAKNPNEYKPTWTPKLEFSNHKELECEIEDYSVKQIFKKEKNIHAEDIDNWFNRVKHNYVLTCHETFELQNFPFDVQDLSIYVTETSGTKKM